MAYCTLADMKKAFSESEMNDLLDANGDGVHDQGKFDLINADGAALIDGYLGVRYAVPITAPVPLVVRVFNRDITRFLLWDDNAPEEVRKRYDDAIARLKDYSKGVMVLPEVAPAPQNPSSGIDYFAEERVFTRDSLSGY